MKFHNLFSKHETHSKTVTTVSRFVPFERVVHNGIHLEILETFVSLNFKLSIYIYRQVVRRFYSQWSFSSKFPRDVTESALMNSSNSIVPSWEQKRKGGEGKKKEKKKKKDIRSWRLRFPFQKTRNLVQISRWIYHEEEQNYPDNRWIAFQITRIV